MDELGYNGAYKGSEIDAAVGAVRQKESTWDGKQDKLTGLQGQVVGFDDDGDAIAIPAPDTGVTAFNERTGAVVPQAGDYTAEMVGALAAPEGGTEGQMLYKSADGVEWGDKPVMVVNIAPSSDDPGTLVADKTYQEIVDAYNNGYFVFANTEIISNYYIAFILSGVSDDTVDFFQFTTTGLESIRITYNNFVEFPKYPFFAYSIVFESDILTSDNVQDAIEEVQSNIPTDYIPTSQKGAASGVAELDSTGKVPSAQLPAMDYIPASEKGANSGVATLGADGILTESQRPTYTASDVGARPDTWTPTADDVGAVPTSRTVNGKALSADISLSAADVGALTQAQGDGRYLQLSGGILTGALKYPETSVFEISNVSANAGGKLQLTYAADMHGAGINVGNTNVFQAIKMDNEGAPTLTLKYVVTPTDDSDAANKAYVDATKPVLRTATLTTSGWSGNSQTVTVNGVVANSSAQLIYVAPANKDSATAWGEAGVFCSAQGANSLTFVCDSVPSANISVNISIQEAQT